MLAIVSAFKVNANINLMNANTKEGKQNFGRLQRPSCGFFTY